MTNKEKEILERDEEQQGLLSAELASRSSFIGAIATLAAFLAIQWGHSTSHLPVAIVLHLAIAISFVLLLIASFGKEYLYPASPSCSANWLVRRRARLENAGRTKEQAAEKSELDLADAFLSRAQKRAESNRKANKCKAVLLSSSGTMAVLSVLVILVLEALSMAGLF